MHAGKLEGAAGMTNLRTIEIDFDVHKKIEVERQSFGESPNTVLRRLLKLPPLKQDKQTSEVDGLPWVDEGVSLPHGSIARMEYNGVAYEALINNGKWLVQGELFDTPSGAASAIATTKGGRTTRLNGWTYWKVQRPGSATWTMLLALRARSTKRRLI